MAATKWLIGRGVDRNAAGLIELELAGGIVEPLENADLLECGLQPGVVLGDGVQDEAGPLVRPGGAFRRVVGRDALRVRLLGGCHDAQVLVAQLRYRVERQAELVKQLSVEVVLRIVLVLEHGGVPAAPAVGLIACEGDASAGGRLTQPGGCVGGQPIERPPGDCAGYVRAPGPGGRGPLQDEQKSGLAHRGLRNRSISETAIRRHGV
jgi:hypothetical protein